MALCCCGGEAASADSRLGLSHSSIASGCGLSVWNGCVVVIGAKAAAPAGKATSGDGTSSGFFRAVAGVLGVSAFVREGGGISPVKSPAIPARCARLATSVARVSSCVWRWNSSCNRPE